LINIPENMNKESAEFGTKIHKLIADISMHLFKTVYQDENRDKNNKEYFILLKKYNEDILLIKNEKLRRCFINFIEGNILDFGEIKEIFLEELFYWKIGNFFIRCQIDRADILKNGLLNIYDYKSGSKKNNLNDSYYKNQIKFYLLAASEYFKIPLAKVAGYIFYLGSGDIDKNILDPTLRNEMEAKIIQAISGIIMRDFKNKSEHGCTRCSYFSVCH